jgi:hypothetical protein
MIALSGIFLRGMQRERGSSNEGKATGKRRRVKEGREVERSKGKREEKLTMEPGMKRKRTEKHRQQRNENLEFSFSLRNKVNEEKV